MDTEIQSTWLNFKAIKEVKMKLCFELFVMYNEDDYIIKPLPCVSMISLYSTKTNFVMSNQLILLVFANIGTTLFAYVIQNLLKLINFSWYDYIHL